MKQRTCANVTSGKRCDDPKRYHKRNGACARGWRETTAYEDGEAYWYAYGEPGDECQCPGFVAPPKELRRRGNVSRKRGAKAERRAIAGPGRHDVVSADEAIEVWTHRIPLSWRNKMAQARRLRSGRTPVLRVEDPSDKYALEIVEA